MFKIMRTPCDHIDDDLSHIKVVASVERSTSGEREIVGRIFRCGLCGGYFKFKTESVVSNLLIRLDETK